MVKTIKRMVALFAAVMLCVTMMSVGITALDVPSLTIEDIDCVSAGDEVEVNISAESFENVFCEFLVIDLDGLTPVAVYKNGTTALTAEKDYYTVDGVLRIVGMGDISDDTQIPSLKNRSDALVLKLKVPEDAAYNTYNISFVTDTTEEFYTEFVDFDTNDINVSLTDGSITTHNWTDWSENNPPTPADDGEESRYCEICGEEEYRSIPSTVTAKSIEIKGVTLIENYDCLPEYDYNEATDEWDIEWQRYNYDPEFTVTLQDDTVLESEDGWVWYEGESYSLTFTDDQSAENKWGKGTHTATGKIFGKTDIFNVEIIENPVESVTVNNVSIIEGTSLNTRNDGAGEYEYYDYAPEFSVKLKGVDTPQSSSDGPITVAGREFWSIDYEDDQSRETPWATGNHTVKAKFLGVETSFTVTITESPFQSIEIKDTTSFENYDSSTEYGYDEETGDIEWQKYNYCPEFTVTLKNNGGTLESEYGWVEYEGTSYCLYFTDDQSAENQWGVGTHTATGKLFGKSDTFNVNIIENPVESVTVDDVSIIEGTNLSTVGGVNGEYQCYDFDTHYTIKFKDDTPDATTDGEYIMIAGREISPSYYDEQSETVVWGVGPHTVTAEFLGVETTFTVTITPSPIKSITAENISVIEGTNGYYITEGDGASQNEWFRYYNNTKVTVELSDGTKKDATNGIKIGDVWYHPGFDDDQSYENQWDVGTHTATASLLGKSAQYSITVEETPIETLTVNRVDVIENIDGDLCGEEEEIWFKYYYAPTFTVTLKDGRTFTSSYSNGSQDVEIDGETYWLDFRDDQSADNRWTLGENTATAKLLGVEATFTVNVIETPFASVVFYDVEVMENVDGYESEDSVFIYNYVPSFKVYFKDSSKAPLISDGGKVIYNNNDYYANCEVQQSAWEVGDYQVDASVLGVSSTIKVTVTPCEYESLTISGANQLVLNFGEEDIPVSRIEFTDRWYEENCVLATLYTAGNEYDAYIYFDADSADLYSKDVYIKIGTFTSNTLSECNWLKVNIFADDYVTYLDAYRSISKDLGNAVSTFDGTVTADNIDHIITLAVNACDSLWNEDTEWETIGDHEYAIMDINAVKDSIKAIFGIENIDITLSKYYDASNPDRIKTLAIGYGGWDTGDTTVVYENGEWILTHVPDYEKASYEKFKVVMDEDAVIKSFEFTELPYVPGDVNADGEVNDADAVHLLMHTFFAEEYPVNQNCDFDSSGEVNDADAVYLLMFTFFPTDYPIS